MNRRYVDYVFLAGVLVLGVLHVDFWAWDKIHPLLLGWIPYHLWYHGLLLLITAAFFFVFSKKLWPDPPHDLFEKKDTGQ